MVIHSIIYNPSPEVKQHQETRLRELLLYLESNSPFYKRKFKSANIQVKEIIHLEDMVKLPTTCKEDLQMFNDDFLCVEKDNIIEYSSTSGTLGSPVTIALTENDLIRLSENEYQSFLCAGCSNNDIFQLMLTLDRQFMAGMAYYSGLRKLGAGIIRLGPGVPSLQLDMIFKLRPTAIIAVPSFILKLIEYSREHNIDLNSSTVKKAVCIGENIRNADFSLNILGKKITKDWNIRLFSTYASTEMQTAFTECEAGQGGHLQENLLILELLDENNKPVAADQEGEVTITTLGVQGMPLLRYKTGDICKFYDSQCSCGRTSLRLSPVIGRKRQMIKFKGTTLYPPALFDLLNEMEEVKDFIVEVFSNEVGLDEVLLNLVPENNSEELDRKIRAGLQARLRVSPHIKYISHDESLKMQMKETSRKPLKFIDRRTFNS